MLSTAALILIVTSKVVLGQDDRWAVEEEIYTLDMAVNSVDDQYDHCKEQMKILVEREYLKEEISDNEGFGKSWKDGEDKYPGPQDNLSRNNLIAIFVYTGSRVYKQFNPDVLSGKQKYIDKEFPWYSLHFFLTQAIQTLKITECTLTYRCTKDTFDENVLNKEIRFGFFASSSPYPNTKVFGSVSCFKIETCYGADVSKYSWNPQEKEVLIPPYEQFKVTAVRRTDWCKTVFVLKSTGIESNLNCTMVPNLENPKYQKERNQYRREGTGFLLF